ncbi:MAG TPA: bifunctional cytidylyltransferase/SDR family oxidoreductase [Microbacteriaceae bacterium]|nr:bifunctional cytidylyltransferase/SDR family oxidoreductase [Microbacteriaceae bacterium]
MGSDAASEAGAEGRPARQVDKAIAVILAGGVGVRAGLGMPKQLARIAGKSILEHTVAAICSSPVIDEVLIMMEAAHLGEAAALKDSGRYPKLVGVFSGGASRNDTTRLAIDQVAARSGAGNAKVLFHDAVRPFVSHRILRDCVAALDRFNAVDTAIPSADTIIQVGDTRAIITDVPRRDRLRRGQTPQAFRLETIRRAYRAAEADPGFAATDDCTVVLRYLPEVPIFVVDGSEENMKITQAIDVVLADKLFQLKTHDPDVFDREARGRMAGKVLVVFGGSEGIGKALVETAEAWGAKVFSFSRGTTGTHVEAREEVRAALSLAHDEAGRVDYVVNCAGILTIGELETTTDDDLRASLEVNLVAPIIIAQEAVGYLRQSAGQLLFFTSSSYTRGRARYGVYSAAKAAIVNLTQSLAEEWHDDDVRVNCVNPERTHTPMRTHAFGEEPAGTLLSPEIVALACLDTLLSPATGQVVDVRRHAAAEASSAAKEPAQA